MTFPANTFPRSSVTPQPLFSFHTLKFELVGQTCMNYVVHLSPSGKVTSDRQMKMNAWARVGKGKSARKVLLQTRIQFCQELEWNAQIERRCLKQFAKILKELVGLEEEVTPSPSQYGGSSSVPSTPPPMYQKTDQETKMRIICSLEGILLPPAGGVEDLDEGVEWVPLFMVPLLVVMRAFRGRYKKRSSVPRAKTPTSIRRSFKFRVKLMDIFGRKLRAF